MKVTKALAPVAVASVIAAGVVGTPVVRTAFARVTLLSDTAIFVGGTLLPTPSATFAQTAADLFLRPLGFDVGDDPMVCVIGVGDCDAPLQVLSTPQLILQGHSSFAGAAEIVQAVQAELAANPGGFDADDPLWVFGYSQGATAGSIAMAQLAHDGVDPQALHFVFIGDPSDADGAWPNAQGGDAFLGTLLDSSILDGNQTPNDAFPTTIYTLPGDPVADYSSNSALGLFYEHVMYLGLTPEQVADHTETVDGLITNIDISGDFDQFGAWLNAFGNGLLDSGTLEGLFNSVVAFAYNIFGNIEDFFTDWMGIDWGGVEETLDFWFPEV
ncbi:PE-PPE domain-containing protein [Mycobacterium shimoidei]|uniref:PE-PPE domain-containing protein n=1 Tax=Mycobacterium shimoidei TaxID=29313 RepID=UPI0008488F5F|nr:PE-PPE domain-containing protein [Mycobacterium shimoidei]MCV7258208.1 PE-PPE domain-containing protein [Mycobacterium shimoidei]ODR08930.1 PE-PPE domain-containing protein [Mycobacterium shimoidei]ORW82319.1 PE-PPE domain-containing protein [Mycobacterium shimoidei]